MVARDVAGTHCQDDRQELVLNEHMKSSQYQQLFVMDKHMVQVLNLIGQHGRLSLLGQRADLEDRVVPGSPPGEMVAQLNRWACPPSCGAGGLSLLRFGLNLFHG